MTKLVGASCGSVRTLGPTTTTKVAARMLAATQVIAKALPSGYYTSDVVDILLALHVAEEDAQYPSAACLTDRLGKNPTVNARWVKALVHIGLIDHRNDRLALSAEGHALLTTMLEDVYAVQRSMD